MSRGILSAGLVLLLVSSVVAEPSIYITGVPDWDQPAMVAGQAPAGAWGAWCVPTATANIMGYYRDKGLSTTIGDATAYPAGGAFGVNADWQDDTADNVQAARGDLGWYYNTNDMGLGGMTTPSYRGTRLVHIEKGMTGSGGLVGKNNGGYFPSHGVNNVSVTNYGSHLMNSGIYSNFDNTFETQSTHDYTAGYNEIKNEINAGRPLMGHFDHFALGTKIRGSASFGAYDAALWGAAPVFDPVVGYIDETTGEVWNPDEGLGHTVTITGYILLGDIENPFGKSDAIIVHDNTDGYIPLVLPWNGSPWSGLTEISNVPEPMTLSLLVLGMAGMAGRRKRTKP